MARQKKRADGYMTRNFTYNGKRYYVYGRTAAELSEKEQKKRDELEHGTQATYNPTLYQYYDHFQEVKRNESKESTIRAHGARFRLIAGVTMAAGVIFGDMHIKEVTRRNIEDAREILLQDGKTPQYLNACFEHLNHVFNCAAIDGTIEKNPCRALKPLKRNTPPVSETKHRALTEEETRLFFDTAAATQSYYIHDFELLIKTGLRIGELAALNRADIDRINGFIHVKRTVSRDAAGGYIIGADAKTKSGQRDIPLTEELNGIIKEQLAYNRMIFGFDNMDGYIFRSTEGGILREYSINREIKKICKIADIEPFTCHCFRNTFATRFIEQRPQDFKILSEILGHKDISITLNLYTHVMDENKKKAMQDVIIKIS
jgi:integrase